MLQFFFGTIVDRETKVLQASKMRKKYYGDETVTHFRKSSPPL